MLDLEPHGQGSRCQVKLLLSKAKPSYVYSILKPHGQSSKSPFRLQLSNRPTEQGKAKLHKLDFQTTWSEFQKPNQTTTEQGKAKLRMLNFNPTWSEFQKHCQTTALIGRAKA